MLKNDNVPSWLKKLEKGEKLKPMETGMKSEYFVSLEKKFHSGSKLKEDEMYLLGKYTSVNVSENTNGSVNKNTSVNANVSVSESANVNENVSKQETASVESGIEDIADKIMNSTGMKTKAKKFEDTHTKQTYWIRNDILKAINK